MKKRLLISTIVASLMMGTVSLSANESTSNQSVKLSTQKSSKLVRIQKTINKEVKAQKKHTKQASKEIMDGLKNTFLAVRALENSNADDAKKLLKLSINSFDTALKANPNLGSISIGQEINVNTFNGDAKELQNYLNDTIELLKKHATQEARDRLLPLEDEMIITTQKLPIDAYLASTKVALKLLESNKKEEALSTLTTGLSLMEMERVIMPIPLMLAEDFTVEASTLDKAKKDEAQKLLSLAQDELKKAVLLGYTQKHTPEYNAIAESISEIKQEIRGKNVVEKLYDKLKNDFTSLISKSRADIVHKTDDNKTIK